MVLNKNSHTAKAEGETFSIDVTSNVNVELKIEHPDNTDIWLEENRSRAMSTNTFWFTAAKNDKHESREGTITLKGGKVTQTIKVKQSAASTDELEKERTALIDLYNSTNGANWTTKTNWCSDKPLGEWYGVTTDADGHVIEIDLSRNNLVGKIPNSIGNLTSLTYLN